MDFVGGINDAPTTADIINSYKVFKQPSVDDTFYYISGLYNAEVDNSIIQMVEENQKTVLLVIIKLKLKVYQNGVTQLQNLTEYS